MYPQSHTDFLCKIQTKVNLCIDKWLYVHWICGLYNVCAWMLKTIGMRIICKCILFCDWDIILDCGDVCMIQENSTLDASQCKFTNNNATSAGAIYVWVSTTNQLSEKITNASEHGNYVFCMATNQSCIKSVCMWLHFFQIYDLFSDFETELRGWIRQGKLHLHFHLNK